MLLSTSKHLGPLQGRWPNLFWELGAKSLRRFETIQSNHGRSTKTLQEVNWTQNWFLSPQIFGITLRMNSHHPNPPAVGLVASFLLSYKFTIWEWSCKRPERNNKNPLWSNKQTCFSSKNLTFFTMFSSNRPTGPQVLVQDLCTQDLEDSKLNGEDPSNCLKQTKKTHQLYPKWFFF